MASLTLRAIAQSNASQMADAEDQRIGDDSTRCIAVYSGTSARCARRASVGSFCGNHVPTARRSVRTIECPCFHCGYLRSEHLEGGAGCRQWYPAALRTTEEVHAQRRAAWVARSVAIQQVEAERENFFLRVADLIRRTGVSDAEMIVARLEERLL